MQNNTKSSAVAGVLGVFLGAFGGHDWYLGNTKKAITHVCLCVGGLILLIIGVILMNLSRDIPVFNMLFVCLVIAAYVILVGNGIWGFIEGVIILMQGDAGLAAKGYQVAPAQVPGAAGTNQATSSAAGAPGTTGVSGMTGEANVTGVAGAEGLGTAGEAKVASEAGAPAVNMVTGANEPLVVSETPAVTSAAPMAANAAVSTEASVGAATVETSVASTGSVPAGSAPAVADEKVKPEAKAADRPEMKAEPSVQPVAAASTQPVVPKAPELKSEVATGQTPVTPTQEMAQTLPQTQTPPVTK